MKTSFNQNANLDTIFPATNKFEIPNRQKAKDANPQQIETKITIACIISFELLLAKGTLDIRIEFKIVFINKLLWNWVERNRLRTDHYRSTADEKKNCNISANLLFFWTNNGLGNIQISFAKIKRKAPLMLIGSPVDSSLDAFLMKWKFFLSLFLRQRCEPYFFVSEPHSALLFLFSCHHHSSLALFSFSLSSGRIELIGRSLSLVHGRFPISNIHNLNCVFELRNIL